eukprot:jgi/Orpsp1_1/1191373/evm.model.d7180000085233.1
MLGGLTGSKMSSSDPNSNIDLLDSPKQVEKKFKAAFCEEGILIPINELSTGRKAFKISRPEKYRGNTIYESYDFLEKAFAAKEIHPSDLKKSTADALNSLLDPIRKEFESEERQELFKKAYPSN